MPIESGSNRRFVSIDKIGKVESRPTGGKKKGKGAKKQSDLIVKKKPKEPRTCHGRQRGHVMEGNECVSIKPIAIDFTSLEEQKAAVF